MSSYAEKLNELRAARTARDKARDELHQERLRLLKLIRAQRKVDRKEVAVDAATLAAIASGRDKISAAAAQLRAIEDDLRALERLQSEFGNAESLLNTLTAEINQIQQTLTHIK